MHIFSPLPGQNHEHFCKIRLKGLNFILLTCFQMYLHTNFFIIFPAAWLKYPNIGQYHWETRAKGLDESPFEGLGMESMKRANAFSWALANECVTFLFNHVLEGNQ